ncbi:hypothetical protein BDP27DRAFT_1324952 [Rhodocollybia butyracea]|uniref:Uncharacterized protein n=1 Tax=Rhodocollybia butyracea TaxID=206335 RepID=A0A9P5PXB7_9AGAR|nr:hypothetical protein BDP27DRAFT_1324952 [Rhodocollybia butyracea]
MDMRTGVFARSINLIALDISDVCLKGERCNGLQVLPTAYHLLETLTVRLFDAGDYVVTPVFPFFKSSALKSLTIKPDDTLPKSGPWAYFSHFMTFVQRSSFSLTTLFIESLNLPDSSMVHLLAHVSTLLDFTLIDTNVPPEESPITEGLIESLHAYRYRKSSPLNGPLLPRLRSLKLTYDGVVFNDQAVVDMIKSRWTSDFISGQEVDCLRSFTMTYRRRKKVLDAYNVLDNIERDGMRLVILWKDDLARKK